MKRNLIFIALFTATIATSNMVRCNNDLPATMPQELTIVYAYATGSLPPPYAYSYVYEWTADGHGKFEYERGYGAVSDSLLFEVDAQALHQFYGKVRDAAVRYKPPRPEDMPVGGSSLHFALRYKSTDYMVPEETDFSSLVPEAINTKIQAILRSLDEPLDE